MSFVFSAPAAFSPSECAAVIALAEAESFKTAGLVGGQTDHNIRRARIAWLDDKGDAAWVMSRVVDVVAEANRAQFGFDLTDFRERLQVAWYPPDGGHFDWHADIGEGPIARTRKLTIVVQLSAGDSYGGGDLEINETGRPMGAARAIGDATLFASFLPHRVRTVERGERYSLTCWVHGPAFR